MYLTHIHPSILNFIKSVPGGLLPLCIDKEYFLIVKAPKETILTAKLNNGFKVYLAPVKEQEKTFAILISAFFDDHDEPLTIMTPLIADDPLTYIFLELFKQTKFKMCFFDDRNIEYLSYTATANFDSFTTLIKNENLINKIDNVNSVFDLAYQWFGFRTSSEDNEAVEIQFGEPLMPDDMFILNADINSHLFNGSNSFSHTTLEREEPGTYQETDIVFLLQRTFGQDQIYLNPIKERDKKELVDILVVTEKYVFLIQAKDSPNTEKSLKASIDRKRIKSINQLNSGLTQLKGAINEIQRNLSLPLLCGDVPINIDFTNKMLVGAVIVKELFDDMFNEYSPLVFDIFEGIEVPVAFFDFPEFGRMTLYCNNEEKLFRAIFHIVGTAFEREEFPRLRFSGPPPQYLNESNP